MSTAVQYMKLPYSCCYLVANRNQAVIFRGDRAGKLEFLQRIVNPEGRLPERLLEHDRQGRVGASARGSQIRHGLGHRNTRSEERARAFAKQLAAEVRSSWSSQHYGDLVVVAEPHFLGRILRALPAGLRFRVRAQVPRELQRTSVREAERFLRRWNREFLRGERV